MLFKKEPTENFSETYFLDLTFVLSLKKNFFFFFIQMKTIYTGLYFCCSLHRHFFFFIFNFTQLSSLKHFYIKFTTSFSVFDNNKVELILINQSAKLIISLMSVTFIQRIFWTEHKVFLIFQHLSFFFFLTILLLKNYTFKRYRW